MFTKELTTHISFVLLCALLISCGPTQGGIAEFDEWTIRDYYIKEIHASGITGEGVNVAIVDADLDIRHEDLRANVVPGLSHRYRDGSTDPSGPPIAPPSDPKDEPTLDFAHGTSTAGIIAAKAGNGIGLTGVAGDASIYAYTLLEPGLEGGGGSFTTENIADAMMRNMQITDVSSNSWGSPFDNAFHRPDISWENAIDAGVTSGSNGKGISYLFGAGNGRETEDGDPADDNSNYDGYVNYYGVMAICAVGRDRIVTAYSEPGANLWLCGPADDNQISITTTDPSGIYGYNHAGVAPDYSNLDYTNSFGGTSASSPFVVGVVALMRQANPNLGWRDVKLILAQTADPAAGSAQGAGIYDSSVISADDRYRFHHDYGFGIVNAERAVLAAKDWTPITRDFITETYEITPGVSIPDNNDITIPINVPNSRIGFIEFVEIVTGIVHPLPGDLTISLISPNGAVSRLANSRGCATTGNGCGTLVDYRFGSAAHLGEAATGTWTIRISDDFSGHTGSVNSISIKLRGH